MASWHMKFFMKMRLIFPATACNKVLINDQQIESEKLFVIVSIYDRPEHQITIKLYVLYGNFLSCSKAGMFGSKVGRLIPMKSCLKSIVQFP